jgi:hypothetical protein
MIKPWAWTVFSANAKIFGFAGILRAFLDRKMKGASCNIAPAILRAPLLWLNKRSVNCLLFRAS